MLFFKKKKKQKEKTLQHRDPPRANEIMWEKFCHEYVLTTEFN